MPRLDDDGSALTLDLHGATVADAVELAESAIWEAARHGRATLRLIHGASTTDPDGRNRTIKTALVELIDSHRPEPVTSSFQTEGTLILGIAPTPRPQPGRITLYNLR